MKRLLRYSLLLALLLPVPGLAAEVELAEVVRAVESPFKPGAVHAVRDVSAGFSQESHIAAFDRTQRGRGEVLFKFDPGGGGRAPLVMFNWQYREPTRQQVVSDGHSLWVYLPDNSQVIQSDIREVNAASAANPITFLSGLGNLSRDFKIAWGEPRVDGQGHYVIRLQPVQESPLIREVILLVDREALRAQPLRAVFPIRASIVIDPSGNRTMIEFDQLRLNRGLGAREFRFKIPAGVEVVRPGEVGAGL